MAWDYDFKAGPATGSLSNLATFLLGVRILPTSTADPRSIDNLVPHRPGVELAVTEFHGVGDFQIRGQVRRTNGAGVVTHVDGPEGHFYENLSTIKKLFSSLRNPMIVQQTAPHYGDIQIKVRPMSPVTGSSDNPNGVVVNCRSVWPFWRSTTQSSATGTSVVVEGDAPISDMILELSGNGRWTHNSSGDYVEIVAGGATIIDCEARTILTNPGGTDNSINFRTNVPWWQYWQVGTNNFTKTVAGTFKWNNSYR